MKRTFRNTTLTLSVASLMLSTMAFGQRYPSQPPPRRYPPRHGHPPHHHHDGDSFVLGMLFATLSIFSFSAAADHKEVAFKQLSDDSALFLATGEVSAAFEEAFAGYLSQKKELNETQFAQGMIEAYEQHVSTL